MKKSIICVLLAASLALSLAACSGGAPAAKESGSEEASVTAEGSGETDAAETEVTVPADETETAQEAVQADTQDAADESAVTASSSTENAADTGDTSAEEMAGSDENYSYFRTFAAPADSPYVSFDIGDLEAYEAFPEETEEISIDKAEFLKTEDGGNAVRFFFRFTNNSDEEISFDDSRYSLYAIQDGNSLETFLGPIPKEEAENISQPLNPGEDIVCAFSYILNTDSPVVLLVTQYNSDYTEEFPVSAKIIDIKE